MKTFAYGLAAGITAAMLIAGSASAAPIRGLDQNGCRWESATNDYRCYRGSHAGRRYDSQREYMHMQMRSERLVPVYVDDDGAPRPMPPHAARGVERPPANETPDIIPIW